MPNATNDDLALTYYQQQQYRQSGAAPPAYYPPAARQQLQPRLNTSYNEGVALRPANNNPAAAPPAGMKSNRFSYGDFTATNAYNLTNAGNNMEKDNSHEGGPLIFMNSLFILLAHLF